VPKRITAKGAGNEHPNGRRGKYPGEVTALAIVLGLFYISQAIGVALFLSVGTVLFVAARTKVGKPSYLTGIALGEAVLAIQIGLVMIPKIVRAATNLLVTRTPERGFGPLLFVYFAQAMVLLLLFEFSALFSGVSFFTDNSPIGLVVSILILIVLLWRLPTRSRIQAWLATASDSR
jgi:hypothetical protein